MSVDQIPIPDEARERLKPFHQGLLRAFIALGEGKPVTLDELKQAMGFQPHEQQQLRKRIQELRDAGWNARRVEGNRGRHFLYALESAEPTLEAKAAHSINLKDRAEVLHRAAGRCQMCGHSVREDGVKLVVDHRIPRDWGGPNTIDNLEALCEECNGGKKNFFATLDPSIMKQCVNYELSIQRIGELLKSFKGGVVPRRLLEVVGQDDEWTRRLRELRDLGWDVKAVQIAGESGSARFAYKLVSAQPWPKDIRSAIAAAAKKRGSKSLNG